MLSNNSVHKHSHFFMKSDYVILYHVDLCKSELKLGAFTYSKKFFSRSQILVKIFKAFKHPANEVKIP